MFVAEASGWPAPAGATGEILIGGGGLAKGYRGAPALTAERFVQHPVAGERVYRTGDLGRYFPDGTIEFLGRVDRLATLFIPLTFLVGVYGMNFEHMPELKWRWGYFAVWGVMLAMAAGLLHFFRKKKWL
jgi:hypothetical protein